MDGFAQNITWYDLNQGSKRTENSFRWCDDNWKTIDLGKGKVISEEKLIFTKFLAAGIFLPNFSSLLEAVGRQWTSFMQFKGLWGQLKLAEMQI